MMPAETDDAFERAADTEYRWQTRRQRRQGSGGGHLAYARASFHSSLNGLLFLSLALGVHWYFVQRITNWVIAHGVLIALLLLSVVSSWGDQRVAEARLMERRASSSDD